MTTRHFAVISSSKGARFIYLPGTITGVSSRIHILQKAHYGLNPFRIRSTFLVNIRETYQISFMSVNHCYFSCKILASRLPPLFGFCASTVWLCSASVSTKNHINTKWNVTTRWAACLNVYTGRKLSFLVSRSLSPCWLLTLADYEWMRQFTCLECWYMPIFFIIAAAHTKTKQSTTFFLHFISRQWNWKFLSLSTFFLFFFVLHRHHLDFAFSAT